MKMMQAPTSGGEGGFGSEEGTFLGTLIELISAHQWWPKKDYKGTKTTAPGTT